MDRTEAEKSLRLIQEVVNRVHDVSVIQNWGGVMIVMGVLDLLAFGATAWFAAAGIHTPGPYAAAWGTYLGLALVANLKVRQRMGGTATYVERHIWGNGLTYYASAFSMAVIDVSFFEPTEALRVMPAHLAIVSGVSFAFLALLDFKFFIATLVFFLVAGLVVLWPQHGFWLLGVVWCLCLVVPGIRFSNERRRLQARGELTELL